MGDSVDLLHDPPMPVIKWPAQSFSACMYVPVGQVPPRAARHGRSRNCEKTVRGEGGSVIALRVFHSLRQKSRQRMVEIAAKMWSLTRDATTRAVLPQRGSNYLQHLSQEKYCIHPNEAKVTKGD